MKKIKKNTTKTLQKSKKKNRKNRKNPIKYNKKKHEKKYCPPPPYKKCLIKTQMKIKPQKNAREKQTAGQPKRKKEKLRIKSLRGWNPTQKLRNNTQQKKKSERAH